MADINEKHDYVPVLAETVEKVEDMFLHDDTYEWLEDMCMYCLIQLKSYRSCSCMLKRRRD